jgi:hypothetical protein
LFFGFFYNLPSVWSFLARIILPRFGDPPESSGDFVLSSNFKDASEPVLDIACLIGRVWYKMLTVYLTVLFLMAVRKYSYQTPKLCFSLECVGV